MNQIALLQCVTLFGKRGAHPLGEAARRVQR